MGEHCQCNGEVSSYPSEPRREVFARPSEQSCYSRISNILNLARNLFVLAADVLVYIHGGIGGAEKAVPSRTIFWIESDADAGRAMNDVTFGGKRLLDGALNPVRHFIGFGAIANPRQKHSKFVSTKPGQHVVGAEQALHAGRNFSKIQVTDLMAVGVVHVLELIEIDIDQTKNARILTCMFNQLAKVVFQRKPIMNLGERVEFGVMDQIGVKPSSFNGQRGECRRPGKGFHPRSPGVCSVRRVLHRSFRVTDRSGQ